LENIGYEVQAFIIPASGINAPHQRERLWIVAHRHTLNGNTKSNGNSKVGEILTKQSSNSFRICDLQRDAAHSSLYANGLSTEGRMDMGGELLEGREREEKTNGFGIISKDAPDTYLHGLHERNGNNEINASEKGFNALNDIDQILIDTERIGRIKKWNDNGQFKETQEEKCGKLKFSRTDSTQDRWRTFPTQSPVCSGDDGISHGLDNITFSKWRNESIKGYGNAVVPQVVYRIFKTIEYIQNLKYNTQSKN
jgi:DNA (cytosine-5)-methyltransferase 1